MNKYRKIILLVIVSVVIYCYSFLNVSAENTVIELKDKISDSCYNFLENQNSVVRKYNPKVEVVTEGGRKKIKVSITPNNPNDSRDSERLKNVRFKLVMIDETEITDGGILYSGSPLSLDYETHKNHKKFVFENLTDDLYRDPDCTAEDLTHTKIQFDIEFESGGDPPTGTDDFDDIEEEDALTERNEIDCDSPKDTFEKNFCIAKTNAKEAQDANYTGPNKVNFTGKFNGTNHVKKYFELLNNQYTKFTCDSKSTYTKEDLAKHADEGYYASTNVGYLYGSGTFIKKNGNYRYRYDPENPTLGREVTCEVTCEEAVTVQYGAPVASKAGLCFEYKVKVTSRVLCNMTKAPEPPLKKGYCTPSPTCTGTNSRGVHYTVTEGGPNSSFDSCIMSCDGGKYSSECSKKCYKEIYHNNLLSYNPSKTKRDPWSDADEKNKKQYGGYYYRNGSSVAWKGFNSWAGRWYQVYYSGRIPENNFCRNEYVSVGGFCRHQYSNGNICDDTCWWNDCGPYLNPYYAKEDFERNMEKYNSAVRDCKAAASCSTSKAEFTITVDYKNGSGEVKTINFPYYSSVPEVNNESAFKKDKACSRNADDKCTNTKTLGNTTIYRQEGCYNESSSTKNLYMVEWGFPGSWINKKTGELSYLNKDGQSGWQPVDKKFCLPFDAQNVNEKWWNYYYTKNNKNPKCPQNTPVVEKYNIRARSTDFGYFGWQIGVDCFYAVNNNSDKSCPPDPDDPNDKIKYVVRSVDLENLFPATDGSSLTTSDSVGRTPGFNWSANANNSKNPNYTSFPLAYAKYIQEKGYSIYSDDNLDYEFYLSPNVLRSLKGSRESDYTDFEGENFTDDNGVVRYKSDLFRDSGAAANGNTAKKVPGVSQLKCNNLGHGTSCQSSGY